MVNPGRTRVVLLLGVIASATVVAVVIVLLAGRGDDGTADDGPTGTVRQFLIAASDGNGDEACGYLTPAEQGRVAKAADPHVPCSDALSQAQLALDGHNDIGDLGNVDFAGTRHGDHATVDATDGVGSHEFGLTVASVDEETAQTYFNPGTNWRIDAGAASLVPQVP